MLKSFSSWILNLGGWTMIGGFPPELKKCVVIGAPHTSNWDFVWGRAALYVYDVKVRYLIKDSYFRWPLGYFFRATGGIGVDRSKSNNFTQHLKSLIENEDRLYILFPPEGTRSRVKRWKTGFYHVAIDCNLPIALGFMDYQKRELGVGEIFYPSGNKLQDFTHIENFYKNMKGRNPQNFNPEIFEREEGN